MLQALVLIVLRVRKLHSILESDSAHIEDRVSAAFLLIMLYGRCRFSDLQQVSKVSHDHDQSGGYMEISTRFHKTGRSAIKKTMLLPVIVPAVGVTGSNWIEVACQVFEETGRILSGDINGPLLRPPTSGGHGFCKRGVTSSECSRFLRGLLLGAMEVSNKNEPHMSSHSLKSTSLSWCSKFGLGDSDRSILGRHSSATSESSAIYARGLSAGPLRRFDGVLHSICVQEFTPDAPRSKYFKFPPPMPAPVATPR